MRADPLRALRRRAVAGSLFTPRDLEGAVAALGLVQLDPIRAPARAQDLILRHRVDGYRAGDLELRYPQLPLAEDYVHVYAVLPTATRRLLHPRPRGERWRVEHEHPRLAARIRAFVARHGEAHPRELQRAFGGDRVVNGWGGTSVATTRMLEAMHHRGELRVVRRDNGIRVYAAAPPPPGPPLPPAARADAIIALLLRLYAPLPEASWRALVAMVTPRSLSPAAGKRAIARALRGGAVERSVVDGVAWVWPAADGEPGAGDDAVRLLAPFDPVVWDRARFERLWGWAYRFEAYTPAAKRVFGYYALPLLWRDDVIGWANAAQVGGRLDVALGWARPRPRAAAFRRELDAELERLAAAVGAAGLGRVVRE